MDDTQFLKHLRSRFNNGEELNYLFFWKNLVREGQVTVSCLSQWYQAPFIVDGQHYSTAEHFMMAEKAALFGDEATRALILESPNPKAAKALGRQIRDFDETAWVQNRYSIVVRANIAKFNQNARLGKFLKETSPRILAEASPVDRIWGIGRAEDDERSKNPNLWDGLNLLGFALMQVRDNS